MSNGLNLERAVSKVSAKGIREGLQPSGPAASSGVVVMNSESPAGCAGPQHWARGSRRPFPEREPLRQTSPSCDPDKPSRRTHCQSRRGARAARDAINRQFESWARSGRATKGDSARTGSTVALHSPRIALAPAVKAAPARIYTHGHR